MKIKLFLLLPIFLVTTLSFSQSRKEELFKRDLPALVEEMEIMFGYDQMLQEYNLLKSFDKSAMKRLPDSLRLVEVSNRRIMDENLRDHLFKEFIIPQADENAERMNAIIKKYGFPGRKRIRKYYNKEFSYSDFSTDILLMNVPEKY